jgi:hypothetical protein
MQKKERKWLADRKERKGKELIFLVVVVVVVALLISK